MQEFLDALRDFLEETGMAQSRLGLEATGDPTLVRRIRQGQAPRLDTADRVLAFMGRETLGDAFRREVDAFLEVTRIKPYLFGRSAAGNPSFVVDLRRGRAPRLDTMERVKSWMRSNCTGEERRAIRALAAGGESGDRDATGANDATNLSNSNNPTKTDDTADKAGDERVMRTMNRRNRNGAGNGAGGTHDGTGGEEPVYLDTRAAAAFLGLSPRTLDRYRVSGDGPEFFRFGNRIRYLKSDVAAWAAARRVRSTSDPNYDRPSGGPPGRGKDTDDHR